MVRGTDTVARAAPKKAASKKAAPKEAASKEAAPEEPTYLSRLLDAPVKGSKSKWAGHFDHRGKNTDIAFVIDFQSSDSESEPSETEETPAPKPTDRPIAYPSPTPSASSEEPVDSSDEDGKSVDPNRVDESDHSDATASGDGDNSETEIDPYGSSIEADPDSDEPESGESHDGASDGDESNDDESNNDDVDNADFHDGEDVDDQEYTLENSMVINRNSELSAEEVAMYKAQGHWRFDEEGYDYDKDDLFFGSVLPFPRQKSICKLIASYFVPKDRIVTIKTMTTIDGSVKPTLVDDYPEEDAENLRSLMNGMASFRSFYRCIGHMGIRMLNFEFIKTTAVTALLSGNREWESTDGMVSPVTMIKGITIHQSFSQQFGQWVSEMALLEDDASKGKAMELPSLREIVFTGMPAGRDQEETGTYYMPSALEKLRALAAKLPKRGMQTWVVEDGGVDNKKVNVRLIYARDIHDKEFGVGPNEVLLDPSQEMKSYRAALSRNNGNKQKNASRRLSAGLPSHSPEKGTKRRLASGTSSRQTKKSPKKTLGGTRHRQTSSELDSKDKKVSKTEQLDRRVSDISVQDASEDKNGGKDGGKIKNPLMDPETMEQFRLRVARQKTQEDKDKLKDAMRLVFDSMLDDI